MKEFINKLNQPKIYLLLTNIFLGFFLVLLSNAGVLPIQNIGDFIFFVVIYLVFALYRPGWSFLFFVGTIALENINLAPKEIGIMVRPYQFIGGLTILAVLIKTAAGRLGFKLPKWNLYDLLLVIFFVVGFLSAIFVLDRGVSIKQSIVVASFVALYFLTRVFIQNTEDLKRISPFFLSSSIVVVLYGIWQNIRFAHGLNSFEVMPGRPNATFTEPDWLGIFLVMLIAIFYVLIYQLKSLDLKDYANKIRNYKVAYLYACLVLIFSALIITVSRSAWLGAFGVTVIFLMAIWTNLKLDWKQWKWKITLQIKIPILISLLLSVAIVYIFNLTSFQLFNRVQSTGTGLQKITITCLSDQEINLPEKINSMDEIEKYGCWQINLEEIDEYLEGGLVVFEIYRPDPNVNIRSQIYQKSWDEIKKHPILGIGWGNIGKILGADERGASLNSSNIFLEIWLGSGIAGLLAFSTVLIYILISGVRKFLNNDDRIVGLFIILGLWAFIVPNLFNAGIMLGFVWLFLGACLGEIKKES